MIKYQPILFKFPRDNELLPKGINEAVQHHIQKWQRKLTLKFCIYHITSNLIITISALGSPVVKACYFQYECQGFEFHWLHSSFSFFHIVHFYFLLFITNFLFYSFILFQCQLSPRNIILQTMREQCANSSTVSDYQIPIYKLYQPLPWFHQLIIGLSPWRSGFNPSPVHVEFVENKVTMGQDIFLCTFVFPCWYYSTNAPHSFIKHQ